MLRFYFYDRQLKIIYYYKVMPKKIVRAISNAHELNSWVKILHISHRAVELNNIGLEALKIFN